MTSAHTTLRSISNVSDNGRRLRFAALIRVSTDRQEEQGESLKVQRQQIVEAVKVLRGEIVEFYGGSEHAMPGYEKKEVDRLIHDARRDRFDAVIVAHEWRWSRDNAKSEEGLNVFQSHGVRFFVRNAEYDLADPQMLFVLRQFVSMGTLTAAILSKASILSRIARAKRGVPTGGHLPWGRTFDREQVKKGADPQSCWGIDQGRKKIIEDVAKRYLAGESLEAVADEYDLNHSALHRVLTKRCGTDWEISFSYPKFKIQEVVKFTIPRLLPESTIKSILKKAAANKTYSHGQLTHWYLLSRMIFCEHCGCAMTGQTNHPNTPSERRYYRHAREKHRACPCKVKPKSIDANLIEANVLHNLFEVFGNPKAVANAIEAAIPNNGRRKELRDRRARIEGQFSSAQTRRERGVKAVLNGTLRNYPETLSLFFPR